MLEQTVQNKPPTPLRGIAIVGLTAAAILLGAKAFGGLERWIGQASSLCFIVYGALIALFLMNRYVMGYHYAASDNVMRVSSSYGRYRRFICDIWFNRVKAWGAPETVRGRCPGARITRCVRHGCDLEPLALAWTSGDRMEILVFQPDAAMRAHILGRLKKR